MDNKIKWLNEPTGVKVEGPGGVSPNDKCFIHRCDKRVGDNGDCWLRKCVGKANRCRTDF